MTYLIGLICFLFVAVFSSQTLVDVSDTFIVLTAGILIYKNKDYSFLKSISKIWYFWTGWLVVIFWGLYLNSQQFPWIYFLEFRWFISFFAMIYVLYQIENITNLMKYLGLTTLILNTIAIFLYFYRNDDRAGGIYNGIMAFSQNMGMVVCFFVTYLTCIYKYKINLSSRFKKLFLIVATTSILLVLMTMTRGVWLASIIGISVSAFFIPKRVFMYTLVGIILLFTSVSYLNASFKDRIYSKSYGAETSNSQRKHLWQANFAIFKDYPFLGAGYTLNNSRLTEYYAKLNIPADEFKSHAHNQYLHFSAGTGLVGLIFYLIFIGAIFQIALKGYLKANDIVLKTTYLSLLSAFISFLIAGLTESNFSISKNRLLFIFFCAFIVSIELKTKKQKAD